MVLQILEFPVEAPPSVEVAVCGDSSAFLSAESGALDFGTCGKVRGSWSGLLRYLADPRRMFGTECDRARRCTSRLKHVRKCSASSRTDLARRPHLGHLLKVHRINPTTGSGGEPSESRVAWVSRASLRHHSSANWYSNIHYFKVNVQCEY